MEEKPQTYKGKITRQMLGGRSKSRRTGFVLNTDEGKLPLVVHGRDVFEQKPFEGFEGRAVSIQAVRDGGRLLVSQVYALDEPGLSWKLTHKRQRVCQLCGAKLADNIEGSCPDCGAIPMS